MANFREYLRAVRASGHYDFNTDEALSLLKISRNAFNCAIYKFKKKSEVVSIAKNFYVIIPPEFQAMGLLPASEIIPLLMKHYGANYYVCLLSSAMYHGATHQKPQVFQVMVNKRLKPFIHGNIRIDFIYKKLLEHLPTDSIIVKTGYLLLASPELTLADLFLYSERVGGLNHIATVLSELIENIEPKKVIELIPLIRQKAWLQRLGYLLEKLEVYSDKKENLIELLQKYLVKRGIKNLPLARELPYKNQLLNKRWGIIENTSIESDV